MRQGFKGKVTLMKAEKYKKTIKGYINLQGTQLNKQIPKQYIWLIKILQYSPGA